jgi:hypothetical protein
MIRGQDVPDEDLQQLRASLLAIATEARALKLCHEGRHVRPYDSQAEREAFEAAVVAFEDKTLAAPHLGLVIAELSALLDASPDHCPDCGR